MVNRDLTGEKFTLLTPIRLVYRGNTDGIHKRGRKAWVCMCDCGNETIVFESNLLNNHTKSCGCLRKRRGADHPNFKTGVVSSGNGYVWIYKPEHRRADKKGYVYEHILVAEEKLGRELTPDEEVHHNNGDRKDNSPENITVFQNRSEHQKYEWKLKKLAEE